MKVFVISLERATERRKFMIEQLGKQRLDYEIIDAVDYRKMSADDFNNYVDQAVVAKNKFFTQGTQACALSHIKVYERIFTGDINMALVLEDDAVLLDNMKDLLLDLQKHIRSNEIISLSYYHRWENSLWLTDVEKTKISHNNSLLYPVDLHHIGSAMAYIITNEAAGKILKTANPVSVIADHWGEHYEKQTFTSFRCLYPQQLLPAVFNSTIDYAGNRSILNRAAGLVRKYKIPFFYRILLKKDKEALNYNIIFRLPIKYHFIYTRMLITNGISIRLHQFTIIKK